MVTFCWLPPESWRTSDAARVSIWSRLIAALTFVRSAPIAIGPHDRTPAMYGRATFSRIDRCISSPSARSAGTYTSPALMASRRMPERDGSAIDLEFAPVGSARAGEDVEQLILALALEGGDAEDLAGAQVERDVVESAADAQVANGEPWRRRLDRVTGSRAGRHLAPRTYPTRSPSMSSTIRSSEPSLMSTTPTVAPSRRTVARSQTAAISISRWEMKMMQRSDPRWLPMTCEHPLGQVGRQRGGHLVEHQDMGLDRERARQVDDPQRGQRQVARDVGQVQVADAQLLQPVAERLDRRLRQAEVRPDVQVRDDAPAPGRRRRCRRAGPRRGACADSLAADRDRAAVRAHGAGEDLDERALAGAVRAHQRVDLARTDGQRRRSFSAATAPYRLATPVASSSRSGIKRSL